MSVLQIISTSLTLYSVPYAVCEVVQTLQLSSDRDHRDVVGDLSVCLDGMQLDPETFASAERDHGKKPHTDTNPPYQVAHGNNLSTQTMLDVQQSIDLAAIKTLYLLPFKVLMIVISISKKRNALTTSL